MIAPPRLAHQEEVSCVQQEEAKDKSTSRATRRREASKGSSLEREPPLGHLPAGSDASLKFRVILRTFSGNQTISYQEKD